MNPEVSQKPYLPRIDGLQTEPRPRGCEKLSGEEKYRLRQGDYRILYEIIDRQVDRHRRHDR